MSNTTSDSYESILNIIEFYRIQPRMPALQIEKIEEYLVLMNAHYQESLFDINECIGCGELLCIDDVVDVLNSYLNKVGEELVKIFPEDINTISPIHLHSNCKISEIQVIQLYRNFNACDSNLYRINEAIDTLEDNIYEENFIEELAILTKLLLSKINSDLVVKVDDLL